jgi:hypothetical protein
MTFLFLIGSDATAEPYRAELDTIEAWVTEMDGRGVRVLGDRVRPPADAKTVKLRHGERVVSNGPFAETKERIGGFDLIDCANMEEAIEIASKHPMARFGQIEIRPIGSM